MGGYFDTPVPIGPRNDKKKTKAQKGLFSVVSAVFQRWVAPAHSRPHAEYEAGLSFVFVAGGARHR